MHHRVAVEISDASKDLLHHYGHPALVDADARLRCLPHSRCEIAPEVGLLHDVNVGHVLEYFKIVSDPRVLQLHHELELRGDVLDGSIGAGLVVVLHHDRLARPLFLREVDCALPALAKFLAHGVLFLDVPERDVAAKLHAARLRRPRGVAVLSQHAEAKLSRLVFVKHAIAGKIEPPEHLAGVAENAGVNLQLGGKHLHERLYVIELHHQVRVAGFLSSQFPETHTHSFLQLLRTLEDVLELRLELGSVAQRRLRSRRRARKRLGSDDPRRLHHAGTAGHSSRRHDTRGHAIRVATSALLDSGRLTDIHLVANHIVAWLRSRRHMQRPNTSPS
mmetsp:Transcript_65773/g.183209  ORF Transcript_65773/g.183209 Transcript_65773/m.183209 type:complete len:334 (-) Transcript_65773:171-1172(-)